MDYRIPNRIIQTGKRLEQSLRNRGMMANIKLLNPDCEYLFFDDEGVDNFIDQECPEYRPVFDSFQNPIQRFDFFRYLAVYRYGGFYFDLDVMLATGLSSLTQFGCVFPFEGLTFSRFLRDHYGMDWEIGNYAFGAAAGHPFLKAVIDNCIRAQQDPSWVKPMMRGVPALSQAEFSVLNTSGPGLVTRTLAEDTELAKLVTVLFPDDVCDDHNWNRFGNFGLHLMEGSWRPQKSHLGHRVALGWESIKFAGLLRESVKIGKTRSHFASSNTDTKQRIQCVESDSEPLVSILIPAFNAEKYIADSVRSAIAQTWLSKEIIVVDDGSSDRTLEIARKFESESVRVVTQRRQGAAAARNKAFSLSRGEYIQWLDADDLLAFDKVALQMKAAQEVGNKRVLLSSGWGRFIHRHRKAKFASTAFTEDMPPLEWLLRKMEGNIFLQTGCWLVSRELTEAAGAWDSRLLGDDDGEYFCRVLRASDHVKFVPGAKVYYRGPGLAFRGLSYVGKSDPRVEALWLSMQLHMRYLRTMENSERAKGASLTYMQTSVLYFHPERPDILAQAQEIARELGGHLVAPSLSWKYDWIRRLLGWRSAKIGQRLLLESRWAVAKAWDYILFCVQDMGSRLMRGFRQLGLRLRGRYQRFVARHLSRRTFTISGHTPIISFTFDDFPRSALSKGGAILRSKGFSGTYYVSLGLAGKQIETGAMFTVEDLQAAVEQGHELGCHTFNHCHAWDTDPRLFEKAIVENGRALHEIIPGASFKSLSFPIGLPRALTKRIVSKYFSCCRGGGQTFNIGEVDLNCLSAYFLEQSRDNPDAVKRMIDQNFQAGGWLIFATHDVCESPTRWGCSPEFFEEVVQYSAKSGAQILPVVQAYEALQGNSGLSRSRGIQRHLQDPNPGGVA